MPPLLPPQTPCLYRSESMLVYCVDEGFEPALEAQLRADDTQRLILEEIVSRQTDLLRAPRCGL